MAIDAKYKSKRNAILKLAKKHGATNVRVFGSAARGDFSDKSDLDLLVTMEPGRSFYDLIALWQALEELLGCQVDLLTDEGLSPYLRDKILEEAIPL